MSFVKKGNSGSPNNPQSTQFKLSVPQTTAEQCHHVPEPGFESTERIDAGRTPENSKTAQPLC